MSLKRFIPLLIMLCLAAMIQAQQTSVRLKGTVLTQKGEPLNGVSVEAAAVSANDKHITTTDDKGVFQFTNLNPVYRYNITFSNIGYETNRLNSFELSPGIEKSVLIRLKQTSSTLNDVVVIGYGTNTKRNVTGAVSSVKGSDLQNQAVSSFDQALAAKMAGVQILQTSGEPGRNSTIKVRGTGSITAGNSPLIVIDGLPLDRQSIAFDNLNINDIASIEVLKDASAAAIYGSRGANGVVLITTKQGETGKTRIAFSTLTGREKLSRKIDMMDAYQYADLAKAGHDNAYLDEVPGAVITTPDNLRPQGYHRTPPELLAYLNGTPGLTNTDWQDEVYRPALFTNNTLSVAGSRENMKYYVSGSYLNQEGIIINSGYKRYSARFNLESKTGKLRFGVNVSPSFSVRNQVSSDDTYSTEGIVSSALQSTPAWPVYNPDGSFNFRGNGYWRIGTDYQHNEVLNPVAVATLVQNKTNVSNLIGRVFAAYELTRGLEYNVSAGGSLVNSQSSYYRPSTLQAINAVNYGKLSNPVARAGNTLNTNWVIEHTLTYEKRINKHHFNILTGFTSQKDFVNSNSVTATNFPNDLVTTINAGTVTSNTASQTEWSLLSGLARLQYDFDRKYLINAAIRSDGSSRFGSKNKWGYFPSVSVGWIASQEKFMQGIQVVSNLKFRASYGLTGNFQIGNYDYIGRLSNDNYVLGTGSGLLTNGLALTNIGNDELGWETNTMINAGLDLGLFAQQLTIELDYYNSNTSNLLLNVPVPVTTGFSTARQNVGKVGNSGFEALITYSRKTGKLNWRTTGNISTNKNKVKATGPGNASIIKTAGTANTYFITRVGSPIGSYYLLNNTGVYATAEELAKSPRFPNSRTGDLKFEDVDGNGLLDVDADRKIVGKYFPDYTFGFTGNAEYNGLDLSISLQGSQGYQIVNLLKRYVDNMEGNFNNMTEGLYRWKSEQDPGNGSVNRANRKSTGNNGRTSTWHMEDGSYVRLQNITLGYNIPTKITNKVRISSLRLFVSAQNLKTWTKYTGYNPEVNLYDGSDALTPGVDYGSYPLPTTYSTGLTVNF